MTKLFCRKSFSWLALLIVVCPFLSGCVYFNTFYNAQKAYDQAIRLHDKRLEKNPEDSVLVNADEKLKFERSIAKASKVLELFPEEKKYQPKALFLIGESFLGLGEYSKAILKYEELQRFYPQATQNQIAEFHKAKCLFLNGQYPAAEVALEQVLKTTSDDETRAEALFYLAQLQVKNNDTTAALVLYEKLLQEQARSPESKGQVHNEAAKLAFNLKQWERSRSHAKATEIKTLPSKIRYRCDRLAAECLYRLNRPQAGISELEIMLKNRFYAPFVPEINLKLAEGYFQLGKPDHAVALLMAVVKLAPKTAASAEAFYRLGERQFREFKNEKEAKVFFDSSAAAGIQFQYGALAQERSNALARLGELRKSKDTVATANHYNDFMIAELFLFRLDNVDSALGHLEKIVKDPRQDSNHSMRAAYARAFIQEEFKHSKTSGDSLYQYVMEKYPNTEYAKQSQRNLGLKPTVQTKEDLAHALFLEAEAMRFSGGDILAGVIPAYAKVIQAFGETREAAKAQFVVAMLFEQMSQGDEKVAGTLDSAIAAYSVIRSRYQKSPYFYISDTKLAAAGIRPPSRISPVPPPSTTSSSPSGSTPAKTPATMSGATPAGATPSSATPSSATPSSATPQGATTSGVAPIGADHARHGYRGMKEGEMPPTPVPAPSVDTSSFQPEGKTKEELDKGYDNVDQY